MWISTREREKEGVGEGYSERDSARGKEEGHEGSFSLADGSV